MKPFDIKRIIVEDFPKDDRQTVDRLAIIWNDFVDNFIIFMRKGIDYQNINQEVKTLSFTTGADGQPLGGLTFKSSLTTNINGIIPASLKLVNSQSVVTQMPFINFIQDGSLIRISYIAGLATNTKYTMIVFVI